MQGISAAKKAGKYPGRKKVIDDKLISEVKHVKQQKMLCVTQIVKITGRSWNTNTISKTLGNMGLTVYYSKMYFHTYRRLSIFK